MDTFTVAYIEAAVWSSFDDEGNPLDQSNAELSDELRNQTVSDCAEFQTAHAALLGEAYETEGYSDMQAGHDFWLTRCGHGAGFWDRGLGDLGRKLTDAAHSAGNVDLYIGDDGLIYSM
jgi:hypothetical protein